MLSTFFKTFLLYIKLLKPARWYLFLLVIMGAILARDFDIIGLDIKFYLFTFIIFQIGYASVYILNDLIDYHSDRLSSVKKHRIIASGKINKTHAFIAAVLLIAASLVSSFYFSSILFWFFFFLLGYNLLYSFFLKHLPYVDSFANAIPYLICVMLGMSLEGRISHYLFLASVLILISGFSLIKRHKELENNEQGRKSLKWYSKKTVKLILILVFFFLLLLVFFSAGIEKILIGSLLLFYLTVIFAYLKLKNRFILKVIES